MRNREDLFALIKAMSKSEKRYFVLDAKKSGRQSSRYLALFDTLSNMEVFQEEKLKKKFPKNLSSDKAYLYEAILRSMRDYRSKSSKAAQVKERLMDARYLHERGLYSQSSGRILEAKAISKELEDQFSLLEILREEQLSLYDRKIKVGIDQVNRIQKEKDLTITLIKEELAYLDIYFLLATEFFKGSMIQDEQSLLEFQNKLPLQLLEKNHDPKSPRARRRYFLSNAFLSRLKGDLNGQYLSYLQAVEWWDNYPALKQEEYHRYVSDVGNLVNTCYKRKDMFSVAQKWIDLLKNEEPPEHYHDQRFVFLTLSVSNLLHFLNQHEFKKAHEMLPEIIEGMNKFGLKKSISILANIVLAYFLAADYENCLVWVKLTTKRLKAEERKEIQAVLRLLGLISRFELDNIDELESDCRSVNRYLKNSGFVKESFELTVLNVYLRQIFNAPISEQKEAFKKFRTYLLDIENQEQAVKPLVLDEFLIWTKLYIK